MSENTQSAIAIGLAVAIISLMFFIIANYHRQIEQNVSDLFGNYFYCDVMDKEKIVGAARIKNDLTSGSAVYQALFLNGRLYTKLDPMFDYKSTFNFGADYRLVYAQDEQAAKALYWADRSLKFVVENK